MQIFKWFEAIFRICNRSAELYPKVLRALPILLLGVVASSSPMKVGAHRGAMGILLLGVASFSPTKVGAHRGAMWRWGGTCY